VRCFCSIQSTRAVSQSGSHPDRVGQSTATTVCTDGHGNDCGSKTSCRSVSRHTTRRRSRDSSTRQGAEASRRRLCEISPHERGRSRRHRPRVSTAVARDSISGSTEQRPIIETSPAATPPTTWPGARRPCGSSRARHVAAPGARFSLLCLSSFAARASVRCIFSGL
jgi:hypothetical protein